jgi:hypothetical protein
MRLGEQRRDYANGTYILCHMPWGLYTGGAALCSDGRVRRLTRISQTADTFFSVPAAVKVKGKTVSGYITFAEVDGAAQLVVEFVAVNYRKNAYLLAEVAK